MAVVFTLVYAVWAALLLTNFDLRPLSSEKFGLVFNDVAARLTHWDFTVNPDLIHWEAFVRDGKTYTYFGILPAIFRIPLVLLGGETVDINRLSCLLAITLVVYFAIRTVQLASVMPDGRPHAFAAPAIAGMLVTGPPIYLLASASIYHEVIFWSVAVTLAFNVLVLRRWFAGETLRPRDYLVLALLGGVCLLTRVSSGLALFAALLFLMLAALYARRDQWYALIPALVLPCVVVACFMLVQLVVNQERWGNFLTFAPWQYYSELIVRPTRMALLLRHGTFAILRVPYALGYYAIGFNPKTTLPAFFDAYYGDIEGPRSFTILCAPLVLLLAGCGIVTGLRRRNWFGMPMLLLAGNCLAPILMLGLPFMSLRYTFDAWGTWLVAMALGLNAAARWMPNPSRAARFIVIACVVVGAVGSHLTLLRYKINYSGTDPAVRYWLSEQFQPLVCPSAKLAEDVKLTDFDPLVTPNCPPLW
jgi:hypothetical protein